MAIMTLMRVVLDQAILEPMVTRSSTANARQSSWITFGCEMRRAMGNPRAGFLDFEGRQPARELVEGRIVDVGDEGDESLGRRQRQRNGNGKVRGKTWVWCGSLIWSGQFCSGLVWFGLGMRPQATDGGRWRWGQGQGQRSKVKVKGVNETQ